MLGIGVNVNQTSEQLPERAGSLRTLTGREWDRERAARVAAPTTSGSATSEWLAGGLDAVYDGLAPRDFLRGRHVSVNGTSGSRGQDRPQGRLEIAVGHGEVVTVESGEVDYER